MAAFIHPQAQAHLPGFLPGADGSDPLFTFVVVLMILLFMAVGVFYLKLHSLPERLAHGRNNTQLQLIAVLGLLALFTHNNAFWVLALLLAVIRLPDFSTPLNSIATSLRSLAGHNMDTDLDANEEGTSTGEGERETGSQA